jgi:hypothetical protein
MRQQFYREAMRLPGTGLWPFVASSVLSALYIPDAGVGVAKYDSDAARASTEIDEVVNRLQVSTNRRQEFDRVLRFVQQTGERIAQQPGTAHSNALLKDMYEWYDDVRRLQILSLVFELVRAEARCRP